MHHLLKICIAATLVTNLEAHAAVNGIIAGGTYHRGWKVEYAYWNPFPDVVGWPNPVVKDTGPVEASLYQDPDIICHKKATNAKLHAKIAAGDKIQFQWDRWLDSHHGPVLTYLAKCNGPCETVDKTQLKFFKIDEGGLINYDKSPGHWASDDLLANNASWTSTIPASITPGNYVVRHEIIALHFANKPLGAQNYPQCINLEITGSGTDDPEGVLGTELYKSSDPGIAVDIYSKLEYKIPGPPLYKPTNTSGSKDKVAIEPSSGPTEVSGQVSPTNNTMEPEIENATQFTPTPQETTKLTPTPQSATGKPASRRCKILRT